MSIPKPKGKLTPYNGQGNKYVSVHRIGKRRKHIDEAGNIFVKCFGKWWKFPEQIDY